MAGDRADGPYGEPFISEKTADCLDIIATIACDNDFSIFGCSSSALSLFIWPKLASASEGIPAAWYRTADHQLSSRVSRLSPIYFFACVAFKLTPPVRDMCLHSRSVGDSLLEGDKMVPHKM